MRFDNAFSQPLCTPSRVKIMTGLYNYRNYDFFGHLDTSEYTFGNLARDAGYKACIAGKWQLNGLGFKDSIRDWYDTAKPKKLGFDEYCLWQLTKDRKQGGRYAHPYIQQNEKVLKTSKDDFGPDIFSNFIVDFIRQWYTLPYFYKNGRWDCPRRKGKDYRCRDTCSANCKMDRQNKTRDGI